MLRVACVTTCRGRLSHLAETLPVNIAANKDYENLVFVVLDYSSNDGLADFIRVNMAEHLASGRLVYYSFPGQSSFHISHAKNMAMRCAMREGAEILVTVDADNRIGPGFARFIGFEMGMNEPGFFLCPNHVGIKNIPHGPLRPFRGYAGRLAVRVQDFVKLGAYDESFDTWRGEDVDLNQRMLRLGFRMGFIPNSFLDVVPHGSDVRFKEYQHAKVFERAYEFKVIQNRTETTVNYGRWGMGTVYRNFSADAIDLGPLPTRVFGIGMHKTSTTSLHHAFQHLGFDSWHWKSNRQAWRIFCEMNNLGRSNLLEESYALCDNPLPLIYRKLDKAYPNSKYILTMLTDENWLNAVECLFDPKRNPYFDWDRQPFSNRIHVALYGRTTFDREIMLARYHQHNKEVLEYFRDRPDDLLVMKMNEMNGRQCWEKLCGFLGKPVPSVDYPHAHKDAPKMNQAWLHAGDF